MLDKRMAIAYTAGRRVTVQKIISLFQRNYTTDNLVRNEVVPGAEWVIAGEGVATRKFDGTCCMIRDGKLYKRHELKAGKTAPAGFEAAQEPDAVTGDVPGWVPVGDGPEDRWHREAFEDMLKIDGTYELIGPKVQGNPDRVSCHSLTKHGAHGVPLCPRDFDGLKAFLDTAGIEGVVWHNLDGRMVKIKRKDFFKPQRK